MNIKEMKLGNKIGLFFLLGYPISLLLYRTYIVFFFLDNYFGVASVGNIFDYYYNYSKMRYHVITVLTVLIHHKFYKSEFETLSEVLIYIITPTIVAVIAVMIHYAYYNDENIANIASSIMVPLEKQKAFRNTIHFHNWFMLIYINIGSFLSLYFELKNKKKDIISNKKL